MKPLLAVDLGGSQLRVCAFDDTGRLRAKVVRSTHQADPGALLRTMIEVRDAAPAPPALAVVGVPGAVEYATGEARHLPNLPHWPEGVSAQPLADALGLPVLLANETTPTWPPWASIATAPVRVSMTWSASRSARVSAWG